MNGYDAAEFEAKALAGDWKAAVSVPSRASLKLKVLQQLMTDDAHDEVRIALAMRSDVTPEQLTWCAQCDSPFMLNRIVMHPRTPLSTVKDIRDRSAGRTGDVWSMLNEVCDAHYRKQGQRARRASQRRVTVG
jgi:hypothetical protein